MSTKANGHLEQVGTFGQMGIWDKWTLKACGYWDKWTFREMGIWGKWAHWDRWALGQVDIGGKWQLRQIATRKNEHQGK